MGLGPLYRLASQHTSRFIKKKAEQRQPGEPHNQSLYHKWLKGYKGFEFKGNPTNMRHTFFLYFPKYCSVAYDLSYKLSTNT